MIYAENCYTALICYGMMKRRRTIFYVIAVIKRVDNVRRTIHATCCNSWSGARIHENKVFNSLKKPPILVAFFYPFNWRKYSTLSQDLSGKVRCGFWDIICSGVAVRALQTFHTVSPYIDSPDVLISLSAPNSTLDI